MSRHRRSHRVPGGIASRLQWTLRRFSHPQSILVQLCDYLGHDLFKWQTHQKSFPGYDLVSVVRALEAFYELHTDHSETIGCVDFYHIRSLRDLFSNLESRRGIQLVPTPPSYTRVRVDVDAEESILTSRLDVVTLQPRALASGKTVQMAVMIHSDTGQMDFHDGPNVDAPRAPIFLSVACKDAETADFFFREVNRLRRERSVYRGKVIDPVVSSHGVTSIAFRPLQHVRREDLILPEETFELIHRAVLHFYKHRNVLEDLGIELKRGILLHSPPGTGKTSIALYLASLLPDFTICFVSGEKLLFPRHLCQMARYLQPTMIVFEDIDLIAQERDINSLATIMGELMNQIDGCEPAEQVLFVMNTNSLSRLEHAVRSRPGRVDQIVQVPLPDAPARRSLIEHFGHRVPLVLRAWDRILDVTDGMTPAMIKEVVKRGVVAAVERHANVAAGNGHPLAVEDGDLLLAVEHVKLVREMEGVHGDFGFIGGGPGDL